MSQALAGTIVQQPEIGFFGDSYRDHSYYPMNLVYRASFRKVLESYKKRLDSASDLLFLKEGSKIDVRIRDYNITTTSKSISIKVLRVWLKYSAGFEEVNENEIDSLTSLRVHLGDVSTATNWKFKKVDPRCRYV